MPRGINGEYYNYRMPFGGNNLDIFKSLTPIIGSAYVYKKSRNINR